MQPLHYRIPVKERLAFENAFLKEFRARFLPAWFEKISGGILVVGLAAMTFWAVPQPDSAIAFMFFACVFAWLWQKAYDRSYRFFFGRYFATIPDSDAWVARVEEEYFVTEHRGLKIAFPFHALSRVYEEGDYVYLDFGSLGRARVPCRVFDSSEHRGTFVALLNSRKKEEPNQALPLSVRQTPDKL